MRKGSSPWNAKRLAISRKMVLNCWLSIVLCTLPVRLTASPVQISYGRDGVPLARRCHLWTALASSAWARGPQEHGCFWQRKSSPRSYGLSLAFVPQRTARRVVVDYAATEFCPTLFLIFAEQFPQLFFESVNIPAALIADNRAEHRINTTDGVEQIV